MAAVCFQIPPSFLELSQFIQCGCEFCSETPARGRGAWLEPCGSNYRGGRADWVGCWQLCFFRCSAIDFRNAFLHVPPPFFFLLSFIFSSFFSLSSSFLMTKEVSFRGLSRLRNGRKIKDFVTFQCPYVNFFLVAKCQVIYATAATYFSSMYIFF